jgi:hypothetical protein
MSNSQLVLGIYQLKVFEILKECNSVGHIDEVCKNIVSLGKYLNEYDKNFRDEDNSETKKIVEDAVYWIRVSGEFLNSVGGYRLMLSICELVSCEDDTYPILLNKLWDGIGTWMA